MELEIKQGFKQTEVGLIPEDWEVNEIKNLSNPVRGGSPRPAGSSKYFNGSYIPWLTVASLTNIPNYQICVEKTNSYLTEAGSHLSRTLEKETVIIANSGATLGVAKILSIKCCANDGVAALLNIDNSVSSKYLVYYINSITKRLREDIATGNGQPNLNTELIGNLSIPLPPTLAEQKAIATALSDVDELISSLDALIAKKKAIKQGAMQQLLTPPSKGGKRLDGFDGEWVETRLGDVADFYKGKGLPKSEIEEGAKYPCVHYGELFTKYNEVISQIRSNTNYTENTFRSKINDVLMPTSDVTPNGLATASAIFENDVILGGDVLVIRPDVNLLGSFLSFQISINKPQIMSLVSGTTVFHLYGSDMAKFKFYKPSIDEQKAIVQILSDMDKELEELATKKEKYEHIKQGMMQELLTGKTRLV
ncbi:S subunit [Maribacter dokdonensis]|uniref:restriction endonuclease subunit S n=1 Tax=Maribacter dokdonensis TaxID=320912 RepID=UPI001B18F3E6|nr:restriction endonuclease subunit S [Maribacter dokdonensis]CAG2534041.1 S subunit [Maribacter dokdonensis]